MTTPDQLPIPSEGLCSDRVMLRPFSENDRGALMKASHDPHIERYTFIQAAPTEQDHVAWVDALLPPWPASTARLAVVEQGCSDPSGSISIHWVRKTNSADSGYWIAHERRGHRLASTALSLVADFVFDVLGVGRLSLLIDLDNHASAAVATRSWLHPRGDTARLPADQGWTP